MGDKVRIAIVGSGPAGLSAAARAAQLGLSHILLEKTDHLSDTIFKYQKGKHVMATPSQLVLRSDCDFEAGKREAVLDVWNRQAAGLGVCVAYDAEIESITAVAKKVERLRSGYLAVHLDNGQVWRHENAHLGSYLRQGEAVTITRVDGVGGYRLTRDAGRDKDWIRVTRVR